MNRFHVLTIALLCSFSGVLLAAVNPASAGTFVMKQCLGSNFVDFQGSYSAVNNSDYFDVVNGCSTSGVGKIGVYQDRDGGSMTFGDGGQFTWTAPPGSEVIGTTITARLNDANNLVAELRGYRSGPLPDLDGGMAHDGEKRTGTWVGPGNPQSMVVARLTCESHSDCPNGLTPTKAFMELTDAAFTVRDVASPVAKASGRLWDWGNDFAFHRGSAAVRIDATDQGSGIAAAWIRVNGLRADFPAPACPGDKGTYSTRFTPCPLSFNATKTLDTASAPFQEGANQVELCVRDYATTEVSASVSCTGARTVLVDNQPSSPPVNLGSVQGTGWQPENGFVLRWGIPVGQKASIVGAVYQLLERDSGVQVDAGYFTGTDIESVGPLQVPGVGEYKAIIYLMDAAINLGHPSETVLRFDDRPPGDVSPEPALGWISKDEMPIEQEIQKAEPGGPSGITGYALAVSGEGPTQPCGTAICLAPELTLSGGAEQRTGSIGGLPEGSHWISSVAVSGARRASLEPGSTMVRVDRTAPSSSISGIPNEWVNKPVAVTVNSIDALSGMQPLPGDDGNPKTVIDAENYAPYSTPGPVANFVVATEGVNRIRYWAEDLAGNANDGLAGPDGELHPNPGQAMVRIDTTPPEAAFAAARDPEDPEMVRLFAEDFDSGVASVSIMIRRVGKSAAWEALETRGGDGRYGARVPSDELGVGTYELKAEVSDKAGNLMTGNRTLTGEPMLLTLPLKAPALLTASLRQGRRSVKAKYGSREFVEGRLTSAGAPVTNQEVRMVETHVIGSRRKTVASLESTDGDGRFRLRLAAGPTREVKVFFDGTRQIVRASSPTLNLNVKGKVAFHIKPGKVYNRGLVKMRGAVGFRGALPPARGKLVAIQFFDPSRRKWRPVEVLRTNRRGRFRYTYRFRTISSAQRIIFRAEALPEAGWPYLPSTSKRRSVIVYPKG